jgi:hypothetical protein
VEITGRLNLRPFSQSSGLSPDWYLTIARGRIDTFVDVDKETALVLINARARLRADPFAPVDDLAGNQRCGVRRERWRRH